ncbi:GDSL esterase/lipase At2g23540-like [Zingiber officinale]|uniref:GDSL esterase/lipase At2g23540-like n=1 Tax=Zingiber officinale TaxID=94328 RepID=UPI001C4C2601|nr:GDSL esterase/lipase At2g23540-like [Zingiber officinale]
MDLRWVAAAVCAMALVIRSEAAEKLAFPGASFVFGDSLVDAGNNNYLPSLSRADLPPNGMDFAASGGQPTGRFTNGRTMADIVGELLGQLNYSQPFLSPETKGPVILNGVNYASGGSGILNSTGRIFVNRLGMDVQIDYFNVTRRQLDELLGTKAAREFLWKKAIFSITVGSNDILNNYLLPFFSIAERVNQTPDAFIADLIAALRRQLIRLYSLDARKIVVSNVGPLGCIPYQKTINQLNENECAGLPNQMAMKYNALLRDLLMELNRRLPGAVFVLSNAYDLVMELLANYRAYGFTDASTACCGNGGQYRGIFPCGPASTMCDDRSRFVFWDPYHPSQAANVFFAKHMADGDTRYISPMNIRQLLKL